jgi:NADPH:quinone reductase-like Zn-dependent oxidoreductase
LMSDYNISGAHYILNCYDSSITNEIAEVVHPFGQVCMISAGKSINSLDLGFFFFKRVTLSFEVVFGRSRFNCEADRQSAILSEIARLYDQGKLIDVLKRVFPFDAGTISGAIASISSGHSVGKSILSIKQ